MTLLGESIHAIQARVKMAKDTATIEYLLKSDPSVRWQTMRDILDKPQSEWEPERNKIEHEGWGKELLSHQDSDGRWAKGGFVPADVTAEEWKTAQPWTATYWSLSMLREFGLQPSSEIAKKTTELVGKNAKWDHDGQPFWDGEVEECINGQTVANGAYFGADISGIVQRLLGEVQPEGGWNCQRVEGSTRASFNTTLCVLEGLLEYEKAKGGSEQIKKAQEDGEEYLLKRGLYKRLSTGEAADKDFVRLLAPWRFHYTILRALEYFRAAAVLHGGKPDPRLKESIDIIRAKRRDDGFWVAEWELKGRRWFGLDDGAGTPSPWLTMVAMRVLKWWDENN